MAPESSPGEDTGIPAERASGGGLSESTRVEAFSDGVLAIVVTLLVLDLKAPTGSSMSQGLAEQWPAYVAYLASFAYAGVIWVNHHFLFTHIRLVDAGVLWRNLLLLFATSVLPFPTSVVSSSFQEQEPAGRTVALVLYACVSASAVASWLMLFHYLSRHPELLHDPRQARGFAMERRRAWTGLGAYALCAVVAFVSADIALALALLVPVFYAVTSEGVISFRRRLRRRVHAHGVRRDA